MCGMQRGMVDGGGKEGSMKFFLSVSISLYEMNQHFIRKQVLYHIASLFYFYCVKLDFETPTILVTGVSMAPCACDGLSASLASPLGSFLSLCKNLPFTPFD